MAAAARGGVRAGVCAEAGCTTKEVQAVTGHASLREVERYTKAAEQEKLARQAVAKLVKNG